MVLGLGAKSALDRILGGATEEQIRGIPQPEVLEPQPQLVPSPDTQPVEEVPPVEPPSEIPPPPPPPPGLFQNPLTPIIQEVLDKWKNLQGELAEKEFNVRGQKLKGKDIYDKLSNIGFELFQGKGLITAQGKFPGVIVPILRSLLTPETPEELVMSLIPMGMEGAGKGIIKGAGKAIKGAKEVSEFAANIKLSKYPEELRGIIKNWADTHLSEVATARRGIQSDAQVLANAKGLVDELGGKFSKLQRRWKPGQAWNAEELVAIRGVLRDATQEVMDVQKIIQGGANTTENLVKLQEVLMKQSSVQNIVHGVTAEAGRALRSFRQEATDVLASGDVARMEKLLAQLGGRAKVEEIAQKLSMFNLDNPVELNNFIRSIIKPKFSDYVTELYYNSILSGPKTHIINSLTNTLNAIASPIERGLAATWDIPLSVIQGRARARFFSEIPSDVFGAVRGLPDGVRAALHTYKYGVSPTQITKWEFRPKAFTGVVGKVINFPSTSLEAADTLMRSVNYQAAFDATAMRMAKGLGLKGEALVSKIVDLKLNPTKELLSEAAKVAEYRLFRQEPGKFTAGLMRLRDTPALLNFPILRFVLPFLRTPVNILKYGLERSPLGILNPKLWTNLVTKKPEVADQLARVTFGSMVAGAVAYYFGEGKITGQAPSNRAERDKFYAEGKQPYAIRIGDHWVSYQRLEPFNQPITLVAAVIEAVKNKEDKQSISEKAGLAATNIAKNFVSQTYMSSIASLVDALSEPERYAGYFLQRFVPGLVVPFSAALRTGAQMLDPIVRKPTNVLEMIESNIPGLSQNVPARETLAGEETQRLSPAWSPIGVTPVLRGTATSREDEARARAKKILTKPTSASRARETEARARAKVLGY